MSPRRLRRLLSHLLGLGITAVFLLPLYWMGVTSLRKTGLPPTRTVTWWPTNPQWQNYSELFAYLPIDRYISNSLQVVIVAVPLTLLTAALAGFAMARLPQPQRRRLVNFSIALLIVPAASVWLFRFQILAWLGLIDSLWALIVPAFAASNPLFVLLFYWSFRRIPADIFAAATLDGAKAGILWWRIGLPLVRPTAVAVTVLAFVMYWSDFVNPVIYISQPQNYTLPIGLELLNQLDSTNWPWLMAIALVMTGPIMLLFVALQHTFLSDKALAQVIDSHE